MQQVNTAGDAQDADDVNDWLIDFTQEPRRNPTVLRDQVLEKLRHIIDPDLHQDIVTLGFVRHLKIDYPNQRVAFSLHLTTPACPVQNEFVSKAKELLYELGWVSEVKVDIHSKPLEINKPSRRSLPLNLRAVSNILLVASCKGGVGKSTIACNLAYMLSLLGAKVGLVDTDIYGPSLPYLLPVAEQRIFFSQPCRSTLRRQKREHLTFEKATCCSQSNTDTPLHDNVYQSSDANSEFEEWQDSDPEIRMKLNLKHALKKGSGGLLPLTYQNVKLMSYGYLKSLDHAPLRGPVASSVVYQMIAHTFWGELDYLILDTPPGTGDIHLTLVESLPIRGVVAVTTPQQLSVTDCQKGLSFFDAFHVKILALVENMSYFVCDTCSHHHSIFSSEEEIKSLVDQYTVPLHIKIPLHKDFSTLHHRKTSNPDAPQFPFALVFHDVHPVWKVLFEFAKNLIRQIAIASFSSDRLPVLSSEPNGVLKLTIFKGKEKTTLIPSLTHVDAVKLNSPQSPMPDQVSSKVPNSMHEVESQTLFANSRDVRLSCRCAKCTDLITGQSFLSLSKIDPDIQPTTIESMGNYTIKILWSDGHESLMTFSLLESIFRSAMAKRTSFTQSSFHGNKSCFNVKQHVDW